MYCQVFKGSFQNTLSPICELPFKNGMTLGTSFLAIATAIADDPASARKAVLFKHRFMQALLWYFKAKRISQNEVYGFTDSARLRFMGHLALQNFIRQVV